MDNRDGPNDLYIGLRIIMSKIYEIYGTDAHEMTKGLMTAAKIANIIPA